MPLQNKQSVSFFNFFFHFLIKYCADLYDFVNMDISLFFEKTLVSAFWCFSGRQLSALPVETQQ